MKHTKLDVIDAVNRELTQASSKYPPFHSAHEGFSVLWEEVDELWDLVKVKQGQRNAEEMQKEAIQIAAMAIRFALDVCSNQNGQK